MQRRKLLWTLLLGGTLLVTAGFVVAACGDGGDEGDAAAASTQAAAEADAADEETQAEPEAEPPQPSTGDPERGRELFFANTCNICHGENGEGGIGPEVAGTALTLEQVIEQYRNPREAMPAFASDAVPDADVADIYTWLQSIA